MLQRRQSLGGSSRSRAAYTTETTNLGNGRRMGKQTKAMRCNAVQSNPIQCNAMQCNAKTASTPVSGDAMQQGCIDERQPIPTTTQAAVSRASDDSHDQDERVDTMTNLPQDTTASGTQRHEGQEDETLKEFRALRLASSSAFSTQPSDEAHTHAGTCFFSAGERKDTVNKKGRLLSSKDGRSSSGCQEKVFEEKGW